MKYFFLNILIITFLASPATVRAQPVPTAPGNNATYNQAQQQVLANQKTACLNAGYYWENNKCSKTSTKTNQTLQRFRPGVDIQSTGKKIGGISFSGVGSSVLGCLDVGGQTVKGINNLFTKGKGFDKLFSNKKKTPKAPKDSSKTDSTGANKTVPTNDSATEKNVEAVKKKESCLDAIAYTLGKQALAQVTNKTLNYINTGFGGNPLYVTNINSFLGSVKNEQVRSYIGLADNIAKKDGDAVGPVVTSKIIEIITGRPSRVNPGPTTPAQQKYDAFTKDFTNGGWDSWYRMTQLGENPIAGILDTSQQLGKSIAQEQENVKQQLLQGGGFLSAQKCVEYAQAPGPDDDPDFNLNPDGSLRCLKYETTTPGSVISSQAQAITNTNTRQLEAADELNEVLGAFFDNMLNKLIQKGLNGLQKETAKGLNGNYSASLISGGNVGGGGGGDLGYQSSGGGIDVQDFDISRPQQLRAVIQTQYDFLNAAQDSQIAMERILPALGALDYCIPGPNPTWTNGLNENFQTFIDSFETPTKEASGLEKFLGAATSSFLGGLFSLLGIDGAPKEMTPLLVGQPTLFDKVTEDNVTISPWSYSYATKDYGRLVSPKNTSGDWIRGYVGAGYDRITTRYQKDFTVDKITALFTAVDPNTSFATGAIEDSLAETSQIINYNTSISSLSEQYDEIISNKEDQLAELESIRKEANAIVKKAKARYIASQAAAGTPVNLSCINRAYVIDESPIVGFPRQESDAENPMVEKMLEANDYFYANL